MSGQYGPQEEGREVTFIGSLAEVLRGRGFSVVEEYGTGGGCTALAVGDLDGRHVLVTDGNLGTDVEETGEVVAVVFTTEGGQVDEGTLILDMPHVSGTDDDETQAAAVVIGAALPR